MTKSNNDHLQIIDLMGIKDHTSQPQNRLTIVTGMWYHTQE